ncbi:hypothetical protein GB931_09130 [Modestobacter sp. I12A-02628]|uniref:Uncharacterized protein n=1 Tax=Goekera deserti TaxID=2497753 RepID=A0A7K3WEN5_9ACTN|nr:hypothetical protein [Goekera deserti]MPQ98080.1 hypothetical protein [Goekera deserti]NDI48727.1 hypothetical protein [Goekera deserti]NEL54894.1 hypothetical protein [Goekera deserti]
MTTIQPARPATTTSTSGVRASALAAWQLVEDARYRGANDRRVHRERLRLLAERAVMDRKLARDTLRG